MTDLTYYILTAWDFDGGHEIFGLFENFVKAEAAMLKICQNPPKSFVQSFECFYISPYILNQLKKDQKLPLTYQSLPVSYPFRRLWEQENSRGALLQLILK